MSRAWFLISTSHYHIDDDGDGVEEVEEVMEKEEEEGEKTNLWYIQVSKAELISQISSL